MKTSACGHSHHSRLHISNAVTRQRRLAKSALASVLLATAASSAWTYDIDLGPLGHACDTCGGGVVGGLPIVGHALNEAQAQVSGASLEQWINASRNTAISGAMPIPNYIRQQLTGYATEAAMDRVRYKIGDGGFLNLARVIEQSGQATAVTLNDLVIFRGPSEAQNAALWAHELTHVDQYRDWGVHDFAIRYARDHGSVEGPAYAKENGYAAWAQQRVIQRQVQYPMQTPPAYGAFCYTPAGRYGPGPLQPYGAPCYINTYRGPLYGRVGG